MQQPHFLSKKQARRLALWRQGLLRKEPFGRSRQAALKVIQQLGYLQIDTISVVRRTHHHCLWVRVPTYQLSWLHELMVEKKAIFEYWSHAAAYLPMEDFRFSLPRKAALEAGERHWFERNKKVIQYVLDRIKAEGPLQARDFETPSGFQKNDMYSWKPAKIALEQLFMEGRLMVRERKGFQKVFDLTERVLPAGVDTHMPSEEEMAAYLIRSCLNAHGLASKKEMGYLRKSKRKSALTTVIEQQLEEGKLVEVEVEGVKENIYYSRPAFLEKLPLRLAKKQLHLLSPFDNAVIQRKRLQQLWDFDYQIECYTPAAKRRFGYFSLPILWGDKLVGRLDPKADRKQAVLFIKNLVLEPDFKPDAAFRQALSEKLEELAAFNACQSLRLERVTPQDFLLKTDKS